MAAPPIRAKTAEAASVVLRGFMGGCSRVKRTGPIGAVGS
jgi:hypothetical protein